MDEETKLINTGDSINVLVEEGQPLPVETKATPEEVAQALNGGM